MDSIQNGTGDNSKLAQAVFHDALAQLPKNPDENYWKKVLESRERRKQRKLQLKKENEC